MTFFNAILIYLKVNKGHERTVKAKKNIIASFIIKGFSIGINLVLVPLTINYLDSTNYGVWVTLSSVVGWFSFFNIGLGSGLRNRFAEALAQGNQKLAQMYVSTTYAVLTIIMAFVLALFYIINPYLNWSVILNTGSDPVMLRELSQLAVIVFTFFCLRFIVRIIATILIADQQPAKASLYDLYSSALSLFFIFILTKTSHGSLLYLGTISSSLPVIVFLFSSFFFFNGKYKPYKPSIKSIDLKKAKDLFSLGIKFFFIQIAVILMYQTNNIIISQLFGPSQVTPYNIAFKYFNIIMMVFTIIIAPFWSAFTEAWAKKEFMWIKTTMTKLLRIWGLFLIIGIFMFICSPFAYRIWIGDKIKISFILSALVALWTIIIMWSQIFVQFLNGIGKIKLQLLLGVFTAVFNVPLALFLGNKFGINGILIANILLELIGAVIVPVQYFKLTKNTAIGIWDR